MAASKLSNACYEKLNAEFSNFLSGEGQERSVSILVSGKTGVGKSHLVNAFVGEQLAIEGERKTPCTASVQSYSTVINGTEVVVFDSSGLQDDSGNDEVYLEDMRKKLHQGLDIILYCIKMHDKRLHKDDKNAIRVLTRNFGKDVWKNAVIALTFANSNVDPKGEANLDYFQSDLTLWREEIHAFFAEDPELKLDPEIYEAIPIVPVGNAWKLDLPTCEDWFSELWIRCYSVMNDSSRINLYRMNIDRFEEFPGSTDLRQRAVGSRSSQATSPTLVQPESDTTQSADDQNSPQPPGIKLDAQQRKTFMDKTCEAFKRHCMKIGLGSLVGFIVTFLLIVMK